MLPQRASLISSTRRTETPARYILMGGFFYAATNRSLDLPPDYFLVQLYNLFGHGLQTLFRMVCANFILPDTCKSCLFLFSIQFAQFILPYPPPATMVEFSAALTKAGKHITLFYHQCSSIMLSISTSVVFIPSRPILPTAAIVFSISLFTSPSPF